MDPQTPRDQFPFTNARVARRWRKLLDERLKDLGVTQARWFTMICLQRGGGGPLWQDSWHYLIFNQLGGSGVDSASLFRRT